MTLAEIIYNHIAPAVLERVVFNQEVIEASERALLFKASGFTPEEIAGKTVAAYGTTTSKLARGLYDQTYLRDRETAEELLPHFQSDPAIVQNNQQASLVERSSTLPMKALDEFSGR